MKTKTYPSWKKTSRDRWESQEGLPNADGKWTPDFILERSSGGAFWIGKMRTSQMWTRFETSSEGKTYYEQAMSREPR